MSTFDFLCLLGGLGAAWGFVLRQKTKPAPPPVREVGEASEGELARLGPELGEWLTSTRRLVARFEQFASHARRMLEEEQAHRGRVRELPRRIEDTNFFAEIRSMRDLAAEWIEAYRGLEPAARVRLESLDPWPQGLQDAFELPWGLSWEDETRGDRGPEILHINRCVGEILSGLRRIQDQVAGLAPLGYR